MHPSLSHLNHRPWALPVGRWMMRQSWCDLLFAHWRIDASTLRRWIPAGLEIQEFDGSAWLGAVPFRMTGVMMRPLPDLPWISAFPELNLRTYVERDGKPGVRFFGSTSSCGRPKRFRLYDERRALGSCPTPVFHQCGALCNVLARFGTCSSDECAAGCVASRRRNNSRAAGQCAHSRCECPHWLRMF
jgi:hypothetical protein